MPYDPYKTTVAYWKARARRSELALHLACRYIETEYTGKARQFEEHFLEEADDALSLQNQHGNRDGDGPQGLSRLPVS